MNKFFVAPRAPLFFLHIPKTAGTSMRAFLADQYAGQKVCPAGRWQDLIELDPEDIPHYDLLQGHFSINLKPLINPAAKTLVLLRDPLNRTLSTIRHLKRDPTFHPLHHRAKDLTVLEILSDTELFAMNRNVQTGLLSAFTNPVAILDELREQRKTGQMNDPADPMDLDLAKRNLDNIDFVGVHEGLEPFLRHLCRSMGFHPLTSFRHDNDAPGGLSDFNSLSDAEIELLRACNDLDLELYDYAMKLSAKQMKKTANADISMRGAVQNLCKIGIYEKCEHSFEIDLKGSIPGSGWHEAETQGDLTTRWTGPNTQFSLELPLKPGVCFRGSIQFDSPQALNAGDFAVSANGLWLPVDLRPIIAGRPRYKATFDIPEFIVKREDGFCQLLFEIPSIFRPSDSGAADLRKLGVAVSAIEFERLN